MKNKISALCCCILIIVGFIIGSLNVMAESNNTVNEVFDLIDGIIDYKISETEANSMQEWIDGELTQSVGVGAEWYIIALVQYVPELDYSAYAAALEKYVGENKIASATTRQRCALALVVTGHSDSTFVLSTLNDSIGKQGIMSWIFGLILLNNGGNSEYYSAADAVDKLLSLQKEDSGWALTGDYSDIDVTAMTVQALAPYYKTDERVKNAVDAAVSMLSEKQLDNGGYKSFGEENPESTAQVIVALSSLGISPVNDSRFIKNECTVLDAINQFRTESGAYSHIENGDANETATVQVFYSLVSFCLADSGKNLYIFNNDTIPELDKCERHNTDETDNTSDPAENEPHNNQISYKEIAYDVIIAVILITVALLWLCKKRHIKNFIFVIVIGVLAICIIAFTDFQSTDQYYGNSSDKENVIGTVTLTIRCDTIIGKSDSQYIPENGIILPVTEFEFEDGDTVFDILTEAARKYSIQMENEGSALSAHGMVYISGINYLYEFDFGDLSGWVYYVNGIAPSVGCGEYTLSDGDCIEWLYTCNLGEDVK